MNVVFRLAYSLAVAIFFILFVIFGQRTFVSEPDYPAGLPPVNGLYCNDSDCFLNGEKLDTSRDNTLGTLDREYVSRFRDYHDDREQYSQFVFLFGAVFGLLAVGSGVALYRRVEALPLGLVLGGLGVVIYGWVESTRAEGDMNTTVAFIAAAIGFIVLAAAGYWFLGGREHEPDATSTSGS